MLLQQLLERNHQNVRQVYLEEKRNKYLPLNHHQLPKKRPSSIHSGPQGLKFTLHKLLHNQVNPNDFVTSHQSVPQIVNDPYLNITLDQFKMDDFKKQRPGSSPFNISERMRSQSKESERVSGLQTPKQKLSKTNLPFYKSTRKNSHSLTVQQRKLTSASKTNCESPKFNTLEKGVFDLPESFEFNKSKSQFTPKNSMIPMNRPHSTVINYRESKSSGRQESIHSRGKMRKHEEMVKKRKAMSQQSFYADTSLSQPVRNISFLKDSEEAEFKNEQGLLLEIGKINLQQKYVKRSGFVNPFSQNHRKSKQKIENQELYSPWKKHRKSTKKSIDLSELIQLHSY